LKIRKITKFEFEETHDIEFIPSDEKRSVYEVWANGVFIEELPAGERPSMARAWYYYEIHCKELPERVGQTEAGAEEPAFDLPSADAGMH